MAVDPLCSNFIEFIQKNTPLQLSCPAKGNPIDAARPMALRRFEQIWQRQSRSDIDSFCPAACTLRCDRRLGDRFSSANSAKASIAGALDAAVLAGAKDGSASWQTKAQNAFTATLAQTGATNVHAGFSLNNNVYSDTVTASVPTKFVGLIGFDTLPVQVTAAASGGIDDTACILTLGSGGMKTDSALTLNGAPNINLTNCGLRSNASMKCNGHNGNALASIAVGTVSGCANLERQSSSLPAIYAGLASNIALQCGAKTGGATWTAGQNPSGTNVIQITNSKFTEYHICGS